MRKWEAAAASGGRETARVSLVAKRQPGAARAQGAIRLRDLALEPAP